MLRENHIFTNVPVLFKLGECPVQSLIARFSNYHQKTPPVSEHRLNVSVRQLIQVPRVDEHVATAV